MLELATLGLLLREPLHGYRLKQQIELFMSGCISVNYGAIYPLLKRLEEQGAISVLVEGADGGQTRKVYRITELGRERWKKEMLEHPHESWVHARSRFMIKFFFFSSLESKERLKLLEHRLMVCRLRLESQEMEPLPSDPYQTAAWQRYTAFLESEIQWLSEQLAREQTNLITQTVNG
ncbi:MAG: PadR family transcriptional regulator [Komarekiella atlantica HA4396-MV6]|jgi:DNA-binding PadR family transcriptional regulator|nr:PadR family transcriptional regulator [Komarekiella atlantica HA4396-MV6]